MNQNLHEERMTRSLRIIECRTAPVKAPDMPVSSSRFVLSSVGEGGGNVVVDDVGSRLRMY